MSCTTGLHKRKDRSVICSPHVNPTQKVVNDSPIAITPWKLCSPIYCPSRRDYLISESFCLVCCRFVQCTNFHAFRLTVLTYQRSSFAAIATNLCSALSKNTPHKMFYNKDTTAFHSYFATKTLLPTSSNELALWWPRKKVNSPFAISQGLC